MDNSIPNLQHYNRKSKTFNSEKSQEQGSPYCEENRQNVNVYSPLQDIKQDYIAIA